MNDWKVSYALTDTTATDAVTRGAMLLARAVKADRLIHLAAGDFTATALLEAFVKPGMLCNFSPMREPTLSALHVASRAFCLKNTPHIGEYLFAYYRNTAPGDVMVVADSFSSYASREILAAAKEKGLFTIHLSGTEQDSSADLFFRLGEGYPGFSIQMLLLVADMNEKALEILGAEGNVSDIWLPFDEEHEQANWALMQKYRLRIKSL